MNWQDADKIEQANFFTHKNAIISEYDDQTFVVRQMVFWVDPDFERFVEIGSFQSLNTYR